MNDHGLMQRDGLGDRLVAEVGRQVSQNDAVPALAGSALERRICVAWSDLLPAHRQNAS